MSILSRKVDAIAQALLAGDSADRDRYIAELAVLMRARKEAYQDVDKAIQDVLSELGVPHKLTGHSRLVTAIHLVIEEPELVHALQKQLYVKVADACNSTPSRVERAIRHAIEVAWDRGDLDTIQRLFGNTVSALKGKATNGEFISRAAYIVRSRLQGGA